MYIEHVPNRNSAPAVLLRESWRENGKTKKRTVGNLSSLNDETVEAVRAALKGEVVPAAEAISEPEKSLEIINSRQHGHVAAIVTMIKKSGLLQTIDRKPSRQRDIVVAMIADRLLHGDSKLATARHCQSETAATTLGELLSLEDLDEHECYLAMDWLLERQESMQKKLAKKHLADGGPVLFDLSSSYFEGHTCPLAKHGYSRDKRGDLPQVNYGMYCNADGVPIGVEVLSGNESDRVAFPKAVERVRNDFGRKNVIFVGDRGMIGGKAIDDYLRGEEGAQWITALNSASIAKLQRQGDIQLSFFDQRDLASITHPDYPDERLIVCRNPLLADERERKREALLAATEKLLAKVKAKVDRKRKPLRGKPEIGIEVGKVVNSKKVAKHFRIAIGDDSFEYSRDQEKIDAEASLDGLYVIRSNVEPSEMSDERVVAHYKNLVLVERAFRSLKSIDIRVRPINHRLADRVRSHIFICMLAYYIEHQMRLALAPLMFVDEEKLSAETRDSVVSPAGRSDSAKRKDATHRNEHGFRLSSFRDILESLSAVTRSTVLIKGHPKGRFKTTSRPTPYQQEIVRHLGIERHL
jgi:transposase